MNPHDAYWHAKNVLEGRFPEGEPIIATNPYYAYDYAINIMHGRFPLGEAAIARNAYRAYLYAVYILQERFWEAEECIFGSDWDEDYCDYFGIIPEKEELNWQEVGF